MFGKQLCLRVTLAGWIPRGKSITMKLREKRMSHNEVDIESLIALSSFEVTEEDKKNYQEEIAEFLEYAEVINKMECDELLPSAHASAASCKVREGDLAQPWKELEELLSNAPVRDKTAYLVPPQKSEAGEEKGVEGRKKESADCAEYEAVIGLEVHAHLKTKSKLFCRCSTEFGKEPNENTCPVCTGQPGALPVINKEAVRMAIQAGLAMNCRINLRSVFERKNYFYPDLPKGYQISQMEEPLCSGGSVEIDENGTPFRIRLNRIHMEEDAGKMVHVGAPGIWGSKASAVDFNRTSVPLIEIVSEPDIHTAKQAKDYVIMLRAILVQLGICDGNLEEGSLRCDANISLRPVGQKELGVKAEVKNMNSFKAIEKAIAFEIERQTKLLRRGERIIQETRLWDENSQKTYSMRSKENSHDYRYFPDPDLLPLMVSEKEIQEWKKQIPISPLQKKYEYMNKAGLPEEQALLLMTTPAYAAYFDRLLQAYKDTKNAVNWFFNEILFYFNGSDLETIPVSAEDFAAFLTKIDDGEISGKIGKEILKKSFETKRSLMDILEKDEYKQLSDPNEIRTMIQTILDNNPVQVADYRGGKEKLFGYFVGEVMKASKGRANPAISNQLLKEMLK